MFLWFIGAALTAMWFTFRDPAIDHRLLILGAQKFAVCLPILKTMAVSVLSVLVTTPQKVFAVGQLSTWMPHKTQRLQR